MRTHDPIYLDGPISAERAWWRTAVPSAAAAASPAPPEAGRGAEPLFRAGLVEEIRREIAAGTYETPEKWEAALERLLDRLDKE